MVCRVVYLPVYQEAYQRTSDYQQVSQGVSRPVLETRSILESVYPWASPSVFPSADREVSRPLYNGLDLLHNGIKG